VAELTVKLALVPLNRTAVAPLKFVPLIVTVVPTAPLVGVKPVISGGLETATVTESDVHRAPRKSRATAVKLCDPLLTVAVFQEASYGCDVSSPPIFTPSTLNWTPITVRPPTMLTPAPTGVVFLTVEPDEGDVIVTINLPRSCAEAGSDDRHIQPRRNSAAARAALTRHARDTVFMAPIIEANQ
jgi:hypothetical protein